MIWRNNYIYTCRIINLDIKKREENKMVEFNY